MHPEEAEQRYMEKSLTAFRIATNRRNISWQKGLPKTGPFSVFLTMHDPLAALLADTALKLWPQCTPIAADGMSSICSPEGESWPERLIRVRHWTAHSHSTSNLLYRQISGGQSIPDFDSPGMLFGTLNFIDKAASAGFGSEELENAGRHPGPLGLIRMMPSGQPNPERVIIFHGQKWSVVPVKYQSG
jgi:hypothetical protein